ncbi:MAG: pterin-binding protein [Chloroflexi bacterium RBG_19FT_COMBO_47_9]|nr:MAG: pterin-binding protein [Chloroflexi bacterium RBG_19FT_COMBO_47_9]
MQTVIQSKTKAVKIDNQGIFTIIGESINPTRRKKLIETLQARDFEYVRELAVTQIQSGADILDVNVGFPGVDDVSLLPEVVKFLNENFDIPLCLDSPNPKAIAAGLAVAPARTLVNSVNGEEKSLNALLPIIKEFGAVVIGLVMDDNGIPNDAEGRTSIAEKILERAEKSGIPHSDVVIDPIVMAVSADTGAALATLQTIEMVHRSFGVNIILGASNVSFGLPDRDTINQNFLALAMYAGASCAITNPVKATSSIRAVDLLMGRDQYASRFIKNFRLQQKAMETAKH